MKLLRHTLLTLMVVLVASSCAEQPLVDAADGRPRVAVTFGIPADVVTKGAAGDAPAISSVWVAEFSASGWFRSWTQAEPVDGHIGATGSAGARAYTVSLPVSDADQRFHIIADPPHTNSMTGMSEEEALSSMYTTGGQECFWQRVVVPGGVRGHIVAGSFVATDATQAAFASLSLVRNTAKIIVRSSTSSPRVLRYALVNTPVRGYAAPLDMSSLSFSEQYQDPASLSFDAVRASYVPRSVNVATTTDASSLSFTTAGTPLFCYERQTPSADPTTVLVETDLGWYKVEILHGMQYVPILRGFTYVVDLGGIDFAGEATAQAALEGTALGDVSANLETASLTTVSSGGHSLTVGFTDYTSTTAGDVAHLSYSFTPTTGSVRVELLDAGSGAVTASSFTATGSSGTVDVPLASPGTSMKKSVLRVTGQATADSRELYRNVTFRVMGRQELGGSAVADGGDKDDDVTVTVTVPEDLGTSLFPMTLYVEADDNGLTSNDSRLSVESGASLFDASKRSFHFVYSIIYTDYYDIHTKQYTTSFTLHMKRNRAATGITTIRVEEASGRFVAHQMTL